MNESWCNGFAYTHPCQPYLRVFTPRMPPLNLKNARLPTALSMGNMVLSGVPGTGFARRMTYDMYSRQLISF